MSTRVRSIVTNSVSWRGRLTLALPRVTPRLALVALGTLVQTVATLGWMSASALADGLMPATWSIAFCLALFCFIAAVMVPETWLAPPRPLDSPLITHAASWLIVVVLGVCAGVSVWAAATEVRTAWADPSAYVSDAAAFNHFDAELVLKGQNPYVADSAFWTALKQFPASGATPLQRGQFAADTWPPATSALRDAVRAETTDPALRDSSLAPESLHSYPALSFLLYVPDIWAGLPSTLPMSLLGVLGMLAAIGLRLPAGSRLIGWGLLFANAPALLLSLRGSFEVFALLPLVLAWQWLPRRWLSAALVGLGCAVKQVVWPLALLYLVLCGRRYGWRESVWRAAISAVAFSVPNLPFIVLSPSAWARSMLLPMSLPLFPDGIGLVGFAQAGLTPLWPQAVYTAAELLSLGALALCLAKSRRPLDAEVALALGLLPLALAWRSLTSYFVWLPALALLAVVAASATCAEAQADSAASFGAAGDAAADVSHAGSVIT